MSRKSAMPFPVTRGLGSQIDKRLILLLTRTLKTKEQDIILQHFPIVLVIDEEFISLKHKFESLIFDILICDIRDVNVLKWYNENVSRDDDTLIIIGLRSKSLFNKNSLFLTIDNIDKIIENIPSTIKCKEEIINIVESEDSCCC